MSQILTSGKKTHQTTEHEQPEVRMIYFEVANHVCIHPRVYNRERESIALVAYPCEK